MSSAKNSIGRRLFLRGVGGVVLGLPLLEAFSSRNARAAAGADPFLAIIASGNGVVQARDGEEEAWWPTQLGVMGKDRLLADKAIRAAGELADYADRLMFVKGVQHALGGNGCNHASGCAQLLTATATLSASGSETAADSESLDTIVARKLNRVGVEPLFLHAGKYQAGGSGFNVPSYISYEGPKQQRTAFDSPLRAYQKIVGTGGETTASDPLAARRKSVNDLLRKEIQALQARTELTSDDRHRLDQHFSTIHDLEVEVTRAALDQAQIEEMRRVDPNPYADENHEVIQRLHMDLMIFAISSGYTRVAVLQVGDREDDHEYVLDGVKTQFHTASHRTLPNSYELCKKVDRIQINHFKYFLDKLAATSTPTGPLLDQGVTVNTNQLGTGPDHSGKNLPYIVSGGASLAKGRYIHAGGVSNGRMLNTLAAAVGVQTNMGGETAQIEDMFA